jgi:light-regulated signal transduction histidine kinase (bacteriophytochrome)
MEPIGPDTGQLASSDGVAGDTRSGALLEALEMISDELALASDGESRDAVASPDGHESLTGLVTGINLLLEREQTAKALLAAKDRQIEEQKREIDQLVYVASHDLQEPLRIVVCFLDLLQRRFEGELAEDGAEFIRYAVDGAHRMQHLIRDLLSYSRTSRRPVPMGPVDLNEAVELAIHEVRLGIFQNRAEIDYQDLPTVYGVQDELVQLFKHLLSNSIKFRGEETPRIEIRAKIEGVMWHIEVTDNGIGIPEKDVERVMQIFGRLHSNHEYDGTGIGLPICKKIVVAHGGQIWITPRGSGTSVHLTLKAPSGSIPPAVHGTGEIPAETATSSGYTPMARADSDASPPSP